MTGAESVPCTKLGNIPCFRLIDRLYQLKFHGLNEQILFRMVGAKRVESLY